METDPTIVEYFAEHERYRCGYCGSKDTNYSHGMWAHQMSVQDYQDLIDRGWRRSGKYCYKPTMNMTCCPQYTIKCGALDFKLNKSHKKIIKRVNKYLITGVKPGHGSEGGDSQEEATEGEDGQGDLKSVESALAEKAKPSDVALPSSVKRKKPVKDVKESQSDTSATATTSSTNTQQKSSSAPHVMHRDRNDNMNVETESSSVDLEGSKPTKHIPRSGSGPDPNKPKCRKAKEIRAERRAMKQSADSEIKQKKPKQNQVKSLEDFLSEPDHVANPAHKLELRLVRSSPPSDIFTSTFGTAHSIYHKYQMTIHKDPPNKPNQSQYRRFLCDSPLVIILCRTAPQSHAFLRSFQESYGIYRKYQMTIHKDPPEECDKMTFQNFLVDSPLEERCEENGPPQGYGSFHHHYLLDGKLIAVGVIDILPACVSSVYLYYDPDYSFLGLGVYSALREIALVRELHRSVPELKYYYMGFYIHTCPKMRYKGQYYPSFLVCPESYEWVPIEKCRPKLDASSYARFSESGVEDKDKDIDVNQVLILHKGNMLPYAFYKMMKPKANDEVEVREYAGFVGKTCAERMLLVRK